MGLPTGERRAGNEGSMCIPHMIHFFGPDGAGKSTQVALLVTHLQNNGVPARKWWVRSPHTIAFVLWRLFVKIGFYRVAKNPLGEMVKLPAVDHDRVLRWFWSIIELIGVLPLVLRTYISLMLGYVLVAERYVLDSVTTIAYFENDMGFLHSSVARILYRFLPKNTCFIFLDANYDAILARRAPLYKVQEHRKPEEHGYGAVPICAVEASDFIEFQRVAYGLLAKIFHALVIDTTTNSIDETFEMVLACLSRNQ